MVKKNLGLRKQRTRQHLIADQSVNHVDRFIIEEGHTAQQFDRDYGYDLLLSTYDEGGYLEPGSIYLQLKAAEALKQVGSGYVFDVDIRDYNLWTLERAPVILILFDASKRRAYWLHVQSFFREDMGRKPKKGAKTVRVRVPARQVVHCRAVAKWRELKWEAWGGVIGAYS
jgi:Domain of unknown function (DUF4365)